MINFKLGEFVRFVEERREGYVTRIIDEQTLAVTDEDGFEIPVLASQVTRVHGRSSNPDEAEVPKAPQNDGPFREHGVYLAVSGDKKAGTVVHFNLINTSSFICLATFQSSKKNIQKGEYYGIVHPGEAVQIFSASLNELDLWPEFKIQILKYSSGNFSSPEPISLTQKFRAKDFSSAKKAAPITELPSWTIQLDEPPPLIDAQKLKESFFTVADEKPKVLNPGKEVDLHIERIREDYQFLSNSEILKYQLEHFHRSLDAAIVHKIGSIIFIHGVGNGTLRNEIHKVASQHPQVRTFMDAHKEKFGYGATELILK